MKNRLSYFLLSLLGFASACNKNSDGGNMCMYGPPPPSMRIIGKVTDTAGRPIKDIKVVEKNSTREDRSQDDGTYLISRPIAPDKTFDLVFKDTDGPANGGSFKQQELRVVLTEEDLYDESYLKSGVDVQLAEEEPSAE